MGSSTTEEIDGTINICAHCREAATLLCYGCHKAPDAEGGLFETVWYCSGECHEADWKFHKYDCRKAQARTYLYRAAETAKLAYFRLVEQTFDLHVVGVEEKGNTLYVHEGLKDGIIFRPFPAEHLNNERDKQAVMAGINGGGSQDCVRLFVEIMLQGVPLTVAEVQILKVKYLRRVVVIEPDGHESDSSKSKHVILKITINEDENYALDITGTQFGFYEPLTPWASYEQNRIETLGKHLPLRPLKDSYGPSSRDPSHSPENERDATKKKKNPLHDQFFDIVGSAVCSWYEEKHEALSTMLKLREGTFRAKQGEFLRLIDEEVGVRMKGLQEVRDAKKDEAPLAT